MRPCLAITAVALLLAPAAAAAQVATPPVNDPAVAVPVKPGPDPVREPRRLVQPADDATEPDPWQHHRGLTIEAGIGIGSFRGSTQPLLRGSQGSLAGPNLGVGWFLGRRLAVGVRESLVVHRNVTGQYLNVGVLGPSVQYWPAPYAFVGGTVGVGRIHDNFTYFSVGFDARVGLAFNTTSKHTFNVAMELPMAFTNDSTYTGLSLIAGYQLL